MAIQIVIYKGLRPAFCDKCKKPFEPGYAIFLYRHWGRPIEQYHEQCLPKEYANIARIDNEHEFCAFCGKKNPKKFRKCAACGLERPFNEILVNQSKQSDEKDDSWSVSDAWKACGRHSK